MKITNPVRHLHLGGRIRYLCGCQAGQLIFGKHRIYNNLSKLKDNMERLGLVVSCNLYDAELLVIEREYKNLESTYQDDESVGHLTESQAHDLTKAIVELEKTVFAEAKTRIIASPTPRRFALDHLLNNSGKILGQGVHTKLTDLAQNDLAYACRCIAFECPTAAAVHILRCIEECVRVLYKSYFPRGNEQRPWGFLTAGGGAFCNNRVLQRVAK